MHQLQPLSVQGFVHRMTLIKDGRKPLVSSWQKYWLQLWGSSLVYFRPKVGKGRSREQGGAKDYVAMLRGFTCNTCGRLCFEKNQPSLGHNGTGSEK